ncbi:MAG: glutamate 5-kinase [Neisseria sp.]|nr:glutamate 5-kinase [Neisseria sp.]
MSTQHIWVVKVGSSLVTNEGSGIDHARLAQWAAQIAALCAQNIQVVLVSSGAIAEGIKRLGWTARPKAVNELQAAAAVGQMGLAQAYENVFGKHGIHTAQILITHDDLSNRTRYLNARSTLRTLLDLSIVPVINENDTVATGEIKLGDNDTLGALVANLIEADLLVILTDQDALYDSDPRKNPHAKKITEISAAHPDLEKMAGGAGSSIGTGGMYTKITAAKRAALGGTPTRIAAGKEPDVLPRLARGEALGTLLTAGESRINARRRWLMDQLQLSGSITVDAGAEKALLDKKSSLLPIGCIAVKGEFHRGEAVAIVNAAGQEIARGLSNYAGEEIALILRTPSAQIENILGYIAEEELIHRDNMMLRR